MATVPDVKVGLELETSAKPGWKTTELYATIAAAAALYREATAGLEGWPKAVVLIGIAIVAAAYVLSRGLAKGPVKGIADGAADRALEEMRRKEAGREESGRAAWPAPFLALALAAAVAVLVLGSGCALLSPPVAFDQHTADEIDATIDHETENHALTIASLDQVIAATTLEEVRVRVERAKESATVRRDGELVRLRTWKRSEEAKKIKDAPGEVRGAAGVERIGGLLETPARGSGGRDEWGNRGRPPGFSETREGVRDDQGVRPGEGGPQSWEDPDASGAGGSGLATAPPDHEPTAAGPDLISTVAIVPCRPCDGDGWVWELLPWPPGWRPCPACGGRGWRRHP